MEGISDIKIVGVDEKRPPRVRKEPYIDLFFKLSHKAPPDWCNAFNQLMGAQKSTGKINKTEGLYIETWIRAMEDIPKHLEQLQRGVAETSSGYIARVMQRQHDAESVVNALGQLGGEQGRLNQIIAGLDYRPDALASTPESQGTGSGLAS